MSIRTVTDVFCDDCGDWSQSTTDKPAKEARQILRGYGWLVGVRDGGRNLSDYCERCRKDHE